MPPVKPKSEINLIIFSIFVQFFLYQKAIKQNL